MDTMGIYNMYFKMLGYTLLSHCLLHFCHFVIFATLLKWNSVFCALRSILWEMVSVNRKSPRDVWIVDSVNNGILWTVASVKVNWLSAVRFINKIILKSGMHDAVHNFSQLTDPRLSSSETFKDQLQWSLFINKTLFQSEITWRIQRTIQNNKKNDNHGCADKLLFMAFYQPARYYQLQLQRQGLNTW